MNKKIPDGTLIYCVREKQKLPAHDIHVVKTANGKYRITGKCPNGHKVSQFISSRHGEGLLGNLLGMPGGKIPVLSDIPLLGSIF